MTREWTPADEKQAKARLVWLTELPEGERINYVSLPGDLEKYTLHQITSQHPLHTVKDAP